MGATPSLPIRAVPGAPAISGSKIGVVSDDAAFRALYQTHFPAVHSYFARRLPSTEVNIHVADVFVVAWRRYEVLPATEHERQLWLYGVARRVLADHQKGAARRARLAQRVSAATSTGSQASASSAVIVDQASTWRGGEAPDADPADPLMRALRRLRQDEQEVLRLTAWEELTNAEAAAVIGCSLNAFNIRLHRARKRLADNYEGARRSRSLQGRGGSNA